MYPGCIQVTFLILDDFPPANTTWVEANKNSWMTEPEKWHREMYQRDIAATKIQVLFWGYTSVLPDLYGKQLESHSV